MRTQNQQIKEKVTHERERKKEVVESNKKVTGQRAKMGRRGIGREETSSKRATVPVARSRQAENKEREIGTKLANQQK